MENWFVLYTAPRAEKLVNERLTQAGVKTFLPLHLAPRRWSDRLKMVEIPLYASYIFVYATDHAARSCVSVPGVARLVFHDGKPATINEKEIAAIHTFLEHARNKELRYDIDEQVLIACGPLKNISGKIKRIGKKCMLLHLEQIGLTVSVEIDKVMKKNWK
ncbi:MAG: UpxY family transcription antiterminator [Prevotellaceae bacterium]|jgi:transcription antitermination factor NusG|nr:UpxY family transcription antiterminator [Prevotellaceae bacterium]